MGLIIYLAFAFFIGAVPFAEYTKQLIQEKAIKIPVKETPRAKLYLILDPWLKIFLNFLDILKAFLVTSLAGNYFDSTLLIALVAFVVVLGQVRSPFAKEIKSKGLPCMLGAMAALDLKILLLGIVLYGVVLALFHYSRLSFVLVTFILPIITYMLSENIYLVLFLLLCFVLTLVQYIPNIKNFFANTEPNIYQEFASRNKK